jgi:hypothetical protein
MKKQFFAVLLSFSILSACSEVGPSDSSYPQDPEDARKLRYGKLSGEGGINLFGKDDEDASAVASTGLAVNAFLWRATLDTLSFIPLASTDPIGGVIITDWYENPEAPTDRFKVNVTILDKRLRSDGLRVSVFKQKSEGKSGRNWRDLPSDDTMAQKLEDAILTRARELKIASTKR